METLRHLLGVVLVNLVLAAGILAPLELARLLGFDSWAGLLAGLATTIGALVLWARLMPERPGAAQGALSSVGCLGLSGMVLFWLVQIVLRIRS